MLSNIVSLLGSPGSHIILAKRVYHRLLVNDVLICVVWVMVCVGMWRIGYLIDSGLISRVGFFLQIESSSGCLHVAWHAAGWK